MNIFLQNIFNLFNSLSEEQRNTVFELFGDFVSLLDSEFENNEEQNEGGENENEESIYLKL